LRQLLANVEARRADFEMILVYDVSRWGRFQDTDESGYYEFL
jgi:DNA invertase Pin-like site-specific DNA recombinase